MGERESWLGNVLSKIFGGKSKSKWEKLLDKIPDSETDRPVQAEGQTPEPHK